MLGSIPEHAWNTIPIVRYGAIIVMMMMMMMMMMMIIIIIIMIIMIISDYYDFSVSY